MDKVLREVKRLYEALLLLGYSWNSILITFGIQIANTLISKYSTLNKSIAIVCGTKKKEDYTHHSKPKKSTTLKDQCT